MQNTSGSEDRNAGPVFDVIAEVRMLSTEGGGRSIAAVQPYRPNHNFGDPENRIMYIGQIELGPSGQIAPGERRLVRIRFFGEPNRSHKLALGLQWRLQEGTQLVGIATLVGLLGEA